MKWKRLCEQSYNQLYTLQILDTSRLIDSAGIAGLREIPGILRRFLQIVSVFV